MEEGGDGKGSKNLHESFKKDYIFVEGGRGSKNLHESFE